MYLTLYHMWMILVTLLPSIYSTEIPDIISYAKVSKNGITTSEARGIQTSSIYIPSKLPKLEKGEAFDYPSTQKYSTLDKEMVVKLDGHTAVKQKIQDRFHPPAGFEHIIAHSNAHHQQNIPDSSISLSSGLISSASQVTKGSSSSVISSDNYATLPQHVYDSYPDYTSDLKHSKNNLPSIIEGHSALVLPDDSYSKIPDSYSEHNINENIPEITSYVEKFPSKPIDYSDQSIINQHPTYVDDSHLHEHEHDHYYPYDIIYDHPPKHHYHHYTTTTTEKPEINDQRLNKRPYSYYYIGKKLWYLPLYFSIYFIIYIAALILKSIARHKINFPSNLAGAAGARYFHDNYYNGPGFWNLTQRVFDAIDKFSSENTALSINSNF